MISYPPAKPPYLTHPDPNPTKSVSSVSDGSGQDEDEPQQATTPEAPADGKASSVSSVEGLTEHEAGLIAECLPTAMHAMDAHGAKRVAALLDERIRAGWHPNQIQRLMGQAPMPAHVHRMAGLVSSRLEHNILPQNAPARLRQATPVVEAPQSTPEDPLTLDEVHSTDPGRHARLMEIMQTNPDLTLSQALIIETRKHLATRSRSDRHPAA